MAKRPSAKKKADDPFASFEDWLKDGPAGIWLSTHKGNISAEKMAIIQANAKLLGNRDEWQKKIEAFESALATLETFEEREKKRSRYEIRFDGHNFKLTPHKQLISGLRFPCSVCFAYAKFGNGDVSFTN
ncbi:MAG: hypothetical protein WBD01_01510, partial [Salaquimonas sp.]